MGGSKIKSLPWGRYGYFLGLHNNTTETGRLFFLEMHETVAIGEKGECFGSRGKTHMNTFLYAMKLSFSFALLLSR